MAVVDQVAVVVPGVSAVAVVVLVVASSWAGQQEHPLQNGPLQNVRHTTIRPWKAEEVQEHFEAEVEKEAVAAAVLLVVAVAAERWNTEVALAVVGSVRWASG